MIAYVMLRGFYAGPEAGVYGRPAIISKGDRVFDCSGDAYWRGVRPGQAVREALLECPSAELKEYVPERYILRERALMDRYMGFALRAEPDEGGTFLEIPDELPIDDAMSSIVPELAFGAVVGAGKSKLASKAVARARFKHGDAGGVTVYEADDLFYNLEIDELWTAPLSLREELKRLGFSRVGELLGIPEAAFRSRFGLAGSVIYNQIRTMDCGPVSALYPPPRVGRAFRFGSYSFEAFGHMVATFLSFELRGRCEGFRRLVLEAEFDDGRRITVARAFEAPRWERESIRFPLLKLLEAALLEGGGGSIESVGVYAEDLAPLEMIQQPLLPGGTSGRSPVDQLVSNINRRYRGGILNRGPAFGPTRRERLLAVYDPLRFGGGNGDAQDNR